MKVERIVVLFLLIVVIECPYYVDAADGTFHATVIDSKGTELKCDVQMQGRWEDDHEYKITYYNIHGTGDISVSATCNKSEYEGCKWSVIGTPAKCFRYHPNTQTVDRINPTNPGMAGRLCGLIQYNLNIHVDADVE